jgi:hypothetical protein
LTDDATEAAKQSQVIVDLCSVALRNHEPDVQMAALADLVSMWLSGWQVSEEQREALLHHFCECVRALNVINVPRVRAGAGIKEH